MRLAVVGHVEWIRFARVDKVPSAGEIAHSFDQWEEAGGGGGVAALLLALLADEAHLFTALGDDDLGRRARAELEARGVVVHEATDERPQRWAFTQVDERGERTITTVGPKARPRGHDDRLPWHDLAGMDAGAVHGAAEKLLAGREPVPAVEEQAAEHLVLEVPQPRDQVVAGGAGAREDRPRLEPFQVVAPHDLLSTPCTLSWAARPSTS